MVVEVFLAPIAKPDAKGLGRPTIHGWLIVMDLKDGLWQQVAAHAPLGWKLTHEQGSTNLKSVPPEVIGKVKIGGG